MFFISRPPHCTPPCSFCETSSSVFTVQQWTPVSSSANEIMTTVVRIYRTILSDFDRYPSQPHLPSQTSADPHSLPLCAPQWADPPSIWMLLPVPWYRVWLCWVWRVWASSSSPSGCSGSPALLVWQESGTPASDDHDGRTQSALKYVKQYWATAFACHKTAIERLCLTSFLFWIYI